MQCNAKHPADYSWSSYRVNGQGQGSNMITPQDEYLRLGGKETIRQANYRDVFNAQMEPGLIEDIHQSTNGKYVLENDRFKDKITRILKRRVSPGKAGRPRKEGVN